MGLNKFRDAARRVGQQPRVQRQPSASGPSLKISAEDAGNLQLMLDKGLLTPDQYGEEMRKLRNITSAMFERPAYTPKSSAEISGSCTSFVNRGDFELVCVWAGCRGLCLFTGEC